MIRLTSSRAGNDLSVVLKSPDALTSSEVECWDELRRSVPDLSHPQLHWKWAQLVARTRPATCVAVLRQDRHMIGFFPFERSRHGFGKPIARPLSDRQALIVRSDFACDLHELWRACGLKSWYFDHVPASQDLLRPHFAITDPAAEVDLSAGYSRYDADLRERHIAWCRQMERKRRKLAREVGPVRFELNSTESAPLQSLIAWKQFHLKRQGMWNVFPHRWVHALLASTITECGAGFEGWLSCLYAGSDLVAVQLNQKSGSEVNAWIPCFAPSFARYSPGALLQWELLKRCGDEGITRVDLGRGLNPLKRILATHMAPLAIGGLDLDPVRHRASHVERIARAWVMKSGLGTASARLYRRLGNWLTRKFGEAAS